MLYTPSTLAVTIFLLFCGFVLGLSFWLGRKAKDTAGYFAAHGTIPWFVNGIAFAGDYLSAASFLGICGMIAFYGYDGFLYSIGYLAGWVVALFVIAEPIKRLGKYTFADALDAKFNSPAIKLTAAISTLVVSIFYLIPQMVGAGALIKPLLGFEEWVGVVIVGSIVTLIVVTAGMVSTTWVQFIKGSLLVVFCGVLSVAIFNRGLTVKPAEKSPLAHLNDFGDGRTGVASQQELTGRFRNYVDREGFDRLGSLVTIPNHVGGSVTSLGETQTVTNEINNVNGKLKKTVIVNGRPQSKDNDFLPVGHVISLGDPTKTSTGPLGPIEFFNEFSKATIVTWSSEKVKDTAGKETTVFYQTPHKGSDLLLPGASPTFKGVRSPKLTDKLDFLSLMLALFCGTASLPHILIRYYTVKDAAAARKSTVVGITAIGIFYVLTMILGLGAMVSGNLDVTNSNMAAPLLAKSFGDLPFAMISAIAFTTVLGTVSGLILAASGAIVRDLMHDFAGMKMTDHQMVFSAKIASIVVGVIAMILGILFQKLNVTFLVGWAFNVAASANLPALIMLLFWKRTTKQGIVASISVGLVTSLTWLLLSAPAYKDVYGLDPARAIAPFSQPGLVTIPLSFAVLIAVSFFTYRRPEDRGFEVVR